MAVHSCGERGALAGSAVDQEGDIGELAITRVAIPKLPQTLQVSTILGTLTAVRIAASGG
jgi:hypothetical protein